MANSIMTSEELRWMLENAKIDEYRKHMNGMSGLPAIMGGTANRVTSYPPELQKKLDELDAEAKRLRMKYKEERDENERQRVLAVYNVKIGDTLYGEDGETATIVWVQSREQGGNLVLNITKNATIQVTELEGGYWRQTEEKQLKSLSQTYGKTLTIPAHADGTIASWKVVNQDDSE